MVSQFDLWMRAPSVIGDIEITCFKFIITSFNFINIGIGYILEILFLLNSQSLKKVRIMKIWCKSIRHRFNSRGVRKIPIELIFNDNEKKWNASEKLDESSKLKIIFYFCHAENWNLFQQQTVNAGVHLQRVHQAEQRIREGIREKSTNLRNGFYRGQPKSRLVRQSRPSPPVTSWRRCY